MTAWNPENPNTFICANCEHAESMGELTPMLYHCDCGNSDHCGHFVWFDHAGCKCYSPALPDAPESEVKE